MVKIVDEKKGSFVELIDKFLNEEKIDHTIKYPVSIQIGSVKIEKEQKSVEMVEKDCEITTYFNQGNEMGVSSSILQNVPQGDNTIITLGISKDSKSLDISAKMQSIIYPLGVKTIRGRANLDISIKDALKEPSKYSDAYIIECGCDYPFGIKCKGTRQRWER